MGKAQFDHALTVFHMLHHLFGGYVFALNTYFRCHIARTDQSHVVAQFKLPVGLAAQQPLVHQLRYGVAGKGGVGRQSAQCFAQVAQQGFGFVAGLVDEQVAVG